MNEARVFADEFQTSFAEENELMRFLGERTKNGFWIRKPTRELRLVPLENSKVQKAVSQSYAGDEEILSDTEQHTRLMLQMKDKYYPIRECAIQTILKRAGISGYGLKRLDVKSYARVINMCLQTAKGVSLIRIADGKVSAAHGGDYCDYKILETEAVFQETLSYLKAEFPGSHYIPESGSYDHMVVTAMWELDGKPELLDTYQEALKEHGMTQRIHAPALRLSTSDVAAKSVTLHPMLLCESNNESINIGHPIRLEHSGDADITEFQKKLALLYSRYQDAVADMQRLLEIPIMHPVNCLTAILKEMPVGRKLKSQVVEYYCAMHKDEPVTAHEIYYALNELSFIAACEGLSSSRLLKIEEEIAKVLQYDWEEYDLFGTVSW